MRVALIPLAGRGQRFRDEKYNVPKPLIKVNTFPMVVAAANALPACDKYIFLCLKDHIKKYHVDKILREHFSKSEIVIVDTVTQGQVNTCLLVEKYIHPDAELVIGACDNGMTYNRKQFEIACNDVKADALIFAFRDNPHVLQNPYHWGWVQVGRNKLVQYVSVKKPISGNPIQDYAVVGTFVFRKAKYFFDSAKQMVEKNIQVNGEFYVDSVMNEVIAGGLNVKVYEIEKYIGWGTPAALKTYEYWSKFFKLRR